MLAHNHSSPLYTKPVLSLSCPSLAKRAANGCDQISSSGCVVSSAYVSFSTKPGHLYSTSATPSKNVTAGLVNLSSLSNKKRALNGSSFSQSTSSVSMSALSCSSSALLASSTEKELKGIRSGSEKSGEKDNEKKKKESDKKDTKKIQKSICATTSSSFLSEVKTLCSQAGVKAGFVVDENIVHVSFKTREDYQKVQVQFLSSRLILCDAPYCGCTVRSMPLVTVVTLYNHHPRTEVRVNKIKGQIESLLADCVFDRLMVHDYHRRCEVVLVPYREEDAALLLTLHQDERASKRLECDSVTVNIPNRPDWQLCTRCLKRGHTAKGCSVAPVQFQRSTKTAIKDAPEQGLDLTLIRCTFKDRVDELARLDLQEQLAQIAPHVVVFTGLNQKPKAPNHMVTTISTNEAAQEIKSFLSLFDLLSPPLFIRSTNLKQVCSEC